MTDVAIPGTRDVRAILDESSTDTSWDAVVVACPPHPRHGGHRGDPRLRSVSDGLTERSVACLRIDYGEWDEGYGEREDVRNAIRWGLDRADRVGVFGYSFGSALAILASASFPNDVGAVSALAPPTRLASDLEVIPALEQLRCPVQTVCGTRDSTVDSGPVAERARERGDEVVEIGADHFFVGQHEKVAQTVGTFLADRLG